MILGLDLGGTKLRAARVSPGGALEAVADWPTGRAFGPAALRALLPEIGAFAGPIEAVGLGFPGLVDARAGIARSSVMLDGWADVPMAALLAEGLGGGPLRVAIENDVNAAALAELEARRGVDDDLALVCLGTGIGGALILGRRLHTGRNGLAGEFGHVRVEAGEDAPACRCGGRGCLGVLAAGAVFAGEDAAALARAIAALGRALGSALNALDPGLLVLGGGIVARRPELVPRIAEAVRSVAMPEIARGTRIEAARAGEAAGALGAARLARSARVVETGRVPTKSYARQYAPLWPTLAPALEAAFFEDEPILGEAVDRFEAAYAARHAPHLPSAEAVGTSSGTDAALLLYRALGYAPGDEVVTNAHTFSGVVSALLLAELRPVLLDPDPLTGRLSPDAVARALGPRTRAVLAVHMHGHPEPVGALADLCAARGVDLLEDCAQAHDAALDGRTVGTFGRAAIFSFHPSKNLGAYGDAGLLLTGEALLAERLRVLRNLGKGGKYSFDALGPNAKLDTLQAVVLAQKLPHLAADTARRRALAARYLAGLRGIPTLRLPVVDPGAEPVWHLFVIHTPHRDALRAHLAAAGVATGLHYPIAAHDQPALRAGLAHCGPLPIARRLAAECLTLPLSHEHTDTEIEQTIEAIRRWRP